MNVTEQLRRAALEQSNNPGSDVTHPEPNDPDWVQGMYLGAISDFRAGRICAGFDKMDLVENSKH